MSLLSDILSRGVERIYPSYEDLERRLLQAPLRLYNGIDPTGPSLHIGHVVALKKLREFQGLGHQVVLLIGDCTALIGDPTGKFSVRKTLTEKEVQSNMERYVSQIGKILNLEKTELRYNSEWLGTLSLRDIISLLSEFTVGQMIERDMFQERVRRDEPIFVHEFLYPALQGYDSVALDVDLEVGGNDQTFNMLAGRTLMKRRGKEKFVLATKLLTDPTGKKMGKTEGNMLALSDSPDDAFGKIMSWPDEMLPLGYELLTNQDMDEALGRIESNPKAAKEALAKEILEWLWEDGAGARAQESFTERFSKGKISGELPVVEVERGTLLSDAVINSGLVESKSQWRRLVCARAVELAGGKTIDNPLYRADKNLQVRIGKSRFLQVVIL